jgi:hypothetical protein
MDISFLNDFFSAAGYAAVLKQVMRQQKRNFEQHRMRARI